MTDRYAGFLVTLDMDVREDDAQATIAAIKQIKGVRSVDPMVGGIELQIATSRVKTSLFNAMVEWWEEVQP